MTKEIFWSEISGAHSGVDGEDPSHLECYVV